MEKLHLKVFIFLYSPFLQKVAFGTIDILYCDFLISIVLKAILALIHDTAGLVHQVQPDENHQVRTW